MIHYGTIVLPDGRLYELHGKPGEPTAELRKVINSEVQFRVGRVRYLDTNPSLKLDSPHWFPPEVRALIESGAGKSYQEWKEESSG